MATTVTIGGSGTLFVGEDKTVRLEVVDSAGVPVDTSAMVIKLYVRKTDSPNSAIIFEKTAVATGAYSATRSLNLQRSVVTFTDTEMNTVKGQTYRHAWKRMDDGSETVIARGPFVVEQSTAP